MEVSRVEKKTSLSVIRLQNNVSKCKKKDIQGFHSVSPNWDFTTQQRSRVMKDLRESQRGLKEEVNWKVRKYTEINVVMETAE